MEGLRNLRRRPLRNGLTITGIVIGVIALVTMGGLAEMINGLIEGGVSFYSDHVSVSAKGRLIPLSDAKAIERVPGVRATSPLIVLPAAAASSGFNLVNTEIVGFGDGYANLENFKLTYGQGNAPRQGGDVALGVTFARQLKASVGQIITLPVPPRKADPTYVPHRFTVVGILNQTLTQPDYWGIVTFSDAQMLLGDVIPPALRPSVDPTKFTTEIDVFGNSGTNLDQLASVISTSLPGVEAQGPSEVIQSLRSTEIAFTLITTAAAVLALVIGGLSVVNTMVIAVTERVREIGLKKALGAHRSDILLDYLKESALIGTIAGISGLALGYLLTTILNAAIGGTSSALFLVTPRLALAAVAFAVLLGTAAGIVPAYRAARLDPVKALRSQ